MWKIVWLIFYILLQQINRFYQVETLLKKSLKSRIFSDSLQTSYLIVWTMIGAHLSKIDKIIMQFEFNWHNASKTYLCFLITFHQYVKRNRTHIAGIVCASLHMSYKSKNTQMDLQKWYLHKSYMRCVLFDILNTIRLCKCKHA